MSFCTDEEFTCDDGNCVDMSLRCDGTTNCQDGSDEKKCRLIVPNIGYNKFMVPPPLDGEYPNNIFSLSFLILRR